MMRRVDLTRHDAFYLCNPKNGPGCGKLVEVTQKQCRACRQFQRRPVAPEPAGEVLTNCVLYDGDTPVGLVAEVSAEAAGFIASQARKWATRNTKGRPRLSGLGDRQAMFGTLQPQALRQRYGCTRSQITRNTNPGSWLAVAQECHGVLADALPEVAAFNVKASEIVADCWKWEGTGWTSGVLNLTQILPYHRDAGNFHGSWSAMIGARSGADGGHLYLPEYDVTLGVGNRSLLCFPGGDVSHGVTPMVVGRGGWRVTAVFYGLVRCSVCAPSEREELERSARRSTARARVIASGAGPNGKVLTLSELDKTPLGAADKAAHQGITASGGWTAPVDPKYDVAWPAGARKARTEADYLDDLVTFARLMTESKDLEPWAGMLHELYANGDVTREEALWLVKLYNCYDALGSAWGVFRRWPTPAAWWQDTDHRDDAADYPCTQERRNLRGGKVLIHLRDYAVHVGANVIRSDWPGQEPWLREGLRTGRPGADYLVLCDHLRQVWGVGRQSAFEWAEFLEKVAAFPITAPNAMLWESEGPRRALQRLYGNPKPTSSWLDARAKECRAHLAANGIDMPWEDFETVICDFNVGRDGRYYVGRHLAALREEINEIADPADRAVLDGAWQRYVPEAWQGIAPGIDKTKLPVYRDTGRLIGRP